MRYRINRAQAQDMPIDGDLVNGSRVFMRNCNGCNSLEESSQGRKTTGPALGLIYGRRAGSDKFYNQYSEQLSRSKVIQTERNLFRFTQNPQKYLKGAKCEMIKGGIEEEEDERAGLSKFLKVFTKQLYVNLRVKAYKVYGKDYVEYYVKSQKDLSEEELKRTKNMEK